MQAGKLIVKLAINPVELRGKQWYKAGMITSLDQVSDFPLCWPDNKPRAAHRIDSRDCILDSAESICSFGLRDRPVRAGAP